MSNMSGDSENAYLSEEVDITGSSGSTDFSNSSNDAADLVEQAGKTLDNLSGISDILIPRKKAMLTGYTQEGTQRLRQILQLGPTTRPYSYFLDKLAGVRFTEQPRACTGSQIVDLTGEEDAAAARMAGQPSKSGRGEDSE